MEKDLNYYKKLDLKYKDGKHIFFNLTRDFVFKTIFDSNIDILKKLLISVLHLNFNSDKSKIILSNVELPKELEKEYQKKVDILVFLEPNLTVNIEVNRDKYENVKRRNFMYLAKIYSLVLNKGENKRELEKRPFYQLNINANPSDNKYGEDIYYYRSERTGESLTDEVITFIKNIEFYHNLYYTEHRDLNEDKLWLVLLASKNFEEAYHISSILMTKKEREKFMDDLERINLDYYTLTKRERESLDKIQEIDTIANAEKRGIEIGIKQEKIEMIKNMIKDNMNLETISKYTGLSKEEIINLTKVEDSK